MLYWGMNKIAIIYQTTFSNAFSSKKIVNILIQIQLMCVPKDVIDSKFVGTPSHYLNQWWPCLSIQICVIGLQWVNEKRPSNYNHWVNWDIIPTSYCYTNTGLNYHYNKTFSTMRPEQHGHHFADVTFKCIIFYENSWIFIGIPLTCVCEVLIDDESTLVQVMAWCRQATSHYLNQCWPRSMTP